MQGKGIGFFFFRIVILKRVCYNNMEYTLLGTRRTEALRR